jgi:hypothetical protein
MWLERASFVLTWVGVVLAAPAVFLAVLLWGFKVLQPVFYTLFSAYTSSSEPHQSADLLVLVGFAACLFFSVRFGIQALDRVFFAVRSDNLLLAEDWRFLFWFNVLMMPVICVSLFVDQPMYLWFERFGQIPKVMFWILLIPGLQSILAATAWSRTRTARAV